VRKIVSLAYVFLAYKLPEQLGRLVSSLYHEDDLFLVHIDAKVEVAPFVTALRERLGTPDNIRFVDRVPCQWCGYGFIDAALKAFDQALSRSSDLTHVVLLSGQDYPIKPLSQIRAHFDRHRGRSFISWSAGDDPSSPPDRRGNERWYWDGDLSRLQVRQYFIGDRMVHLPNRFVPFFPRRRKIPLGWRPYKGLAYWGLSVEAVTYVQRLVATHPELVGYFRRTFGPDEFFFQMALLNSPLQTSLVNEDLHYLSFEGWRPLTIRSEELPELTRSSKLFARKFDETVDATVLDRIDSTLL
jgi:hypothetical protein